MTYPHITALIDDFSLFDDWEDKYAYIIDLGKQLAPMNEDLKVQENKVHGCTSQVWMVLGLKDDHMTITADSDAHIVRGLIALLVRIFEQLPIQHAANLDMQDLFHHLGLHQHLSPNRSNGFFAMVKKIQEFAQKSK
tara:strand:- start:405 stop:815 length:411 start_codon:yes stop_codon:yes gene_type:complete